MSAGHVRGRLPGPLKDELEFIRKREPGAYCPSGISSFNRRRSNPNTAQISNMFKGRK